MFRYIIMLENLIIVKLREMYVEKPVILPQNLRLSTQEKSRVDDFADKKKLTLLAKH